MAKNLTGVPAADAAAAAGAATVASVSVTDTAADVQTYLDSLESVAASGKLAAIKLTGGGTPTLTITVQQYTADAGAIAAIASPYRLAVTGAPAADANLALGAANVATLDVADTASAIQADLDTLQTLQTAGKLGTVSISGGGPSTLTITQTQLTNDSGVLGQFVGTVSFDVTSVSAAGATSVVAQPNVAAVAVSDTAGNVQNNLAALESLAVAGELTAIALTNSQTLSVTDAQYSADSAALAALSAFDTVEIVPAVSEALPNVSASFTPAVAAQLQAQLTALQPAGTALNVATVSATGAGTNYANATVSNALNVLVFAPTDGNVIALPAGYEVGYAADANDELEDESVGNAVLVGAGANDTLTGAFNDTLYGGDGNATLLATNGNETLIGGTGTNLLSAGTGNDAITSQGIDTIAAGSTGADTISASGPSALVFGQGAPLDVIGGAGALTVAGGSGGNTVTGGGGSALIFGTSELNYAGGAGAATVVGGSAGNTVTGGSGSLLVFANNSLTFTGGSGAATVVGNSVPVAATLAGGGGALFGAAGGSNTLVATGGNASLVGGSGGDTLFATGAGNDLLVAGSGSEALTGASATGNLTMFGGSGFDTLTGGSGNDVFVPGSGDGTITGGAGNNDYLIFASPGASRVITITDFNPTTNAIGLYGFGSGADAAALASVGKLVGGATGVTLSDGTRIVFDGAPTLHSYNFF